MDGEKGDTQILVSPSNAFRWPIYRSWYAHVNECIAPGAEYYIDFGFVNKTISHRFMLRITAMASAAINGNLSLMMALHGIDRAISEGYMANQIWTVYG